MSIVRIGVVWHLGVVHILGIVGVYQSKVLTIVHGATATVHRGHVANGIIMCYVISRLYGHEFMTNPSNLLLMLQPNSFLRLVARHFCC